MEKHDSVSKTEKHSQCPSKDVPALMQSSFSWLYVLLNSVHTHHQMFLEFSTRGERRSAAPSSCPHLKNELSYTPASLWCQLTT